MARAAEAGVVGSRRLGSTRLVAADSPLTGPLTESVAGVDAVYLFGSWAARYAGQRGRAPADIDVLVIGRPDRHELDEAVQARSRLIRKCAPHPLVREVKRCWSGRLI